MDLLHAVFHSGAAKYGLIAIRPYFMILTASQSQARCFIDRDAFHFMHAPAKDSPFRKELVRLVR